jgi:hypothetical protein
MRGRKRTEKMVAAPDAAVSFTIQAIETGQGAFLTNLLHQRLYRQGQ